MGLSGLLRSASVRGIAHLSIGTAVAQSVAVIVAPILTRLYSPDDYGALAVFAASVSIGMSVATGRYEAAVSLPPESPEGEWQAIALVRLATLVAGSVSLLGLVTITIARTLGYDPWFKGLGNWAFAIPLAVFLGCLSQTLMAYAIRRRQYTNVAQVEPLRRIVSALTQVILGIRGAGLSGLMLGTLIAPFVGLSPLSRVYREGVRSYAPVSHNSVLGGVWTAARSYSDFPRISLWSNLLLALAGNAQILILGLFFTQGEVGQVSLAVIVVSMPASLVAVSVAQVFQRELAARYRDIESSLALATRVVRNLAFVSLIPFLVLAVFGEALFTFVFGQEWTTAGAIATALVPLTWCRFVSTSMSFVFPIYRRSGLQLTWQAITLVVTSGAYVVAATDGLTIVAATWWASLLTAPLYLALIPLARRVIRTSAAQAEGDST